MENPYQTPQATQAPVVSDTTPLTLKQMLFSIHGRIPRSQWWLYTILTSIILQIIMYAILYVSVSEEGVSPIGIILVLLIYVAFIWVAICLNAKRCHDCDKSGWFSLIPIYGFILTGFIKGTPGPNRFGADPLGQVSY